MNRREFVKALAGIPLLGLLVKLPEVEEEGSYRWAEPGELCIGYEDGGGLYVNKDGSCYIGDKEPYLPLDAQAQPPFSIMVDGVDISEHVESYKLAESNAGNDANVGWLEIDENGTHRYIALY